MREIQLISLYLGHNIRYRYVDIKTNVDREDVATEYLPHHLLHLLFSTFTEPCLLFEPFLRVLIKRRNTDTRG